MKQKVKYYNRNLRPGDPLFLDTYHIRMMLSYVNSGRTNERSMFYHNFRKIPDDLESQYFVVCGVSFILEHLANFSFEEEDIQDILWIAKEQGMNVTKEFVEYLRNFKFGANVWVVPDGGIGYPGEPVVKVEGTVVESLIVESAIISLVTYATLVATRTSRVVEAAAGVPVFEYGLRRSPNPMMSAFSAIAGGANGTSFARAARVFGVPTSGTMAHAFSMLYGPLHEVEAFVDFYRTTGSNVFLVDTYNVIEGIKNAIKTAKILNVKIIVRLDSGDPVELSRKVEELNEEGWILGIILTDDLNAKKIRRIRQAGIKPIAFGVGTYLVVVPAANSVYKLTESFKDSEGWIPKMKLSANSSKSTLPGDFIIWRRRVGDQTVEDAIALRDEGAPGNDYEEVMVQAMRDGELIRSLPSLVEIRADTLKNVSMLPFAQRTFENPTAYPVRKSRKLQELTEKLVKEARIKQAQA